MDRYEKGTIVSALSDNSIGLTEKYGLGLYIPVIVSKIIKLTSGGYKYHVVDQDNEKFILIEKPTC